MAFGHGGSDHGPAAAASVGDRRGLGAGVVTDRPAVCASIGVRTSPRRRSRHLQAAVAGQSWGDRVRLRVQPADVADGLPQGHFDIVMLNSVVQYFPSAGYLADVHRQWRWIAGTGRGTVHRRRA